MIMLSDTEAELKKALLIKEKGVFKIYRLSTKKQLGIPSLE